MLFRAVVFVLALLAAMTSSQVPEFAQQYRQRLGGAIDELARILTHFDEDAARSGYDRAGALALMARDAEQLVRDQAGRMREDIDRYSRLVEQQQAFSKSGPFGRLAAFFADFDTPLVENTMHDFEPANITPSSVVGLRRRHRRRARRYQTVNRDEDETVADRRRAEPRRDTE